MTEGWWNLGRDLQTSKYPLPPINIFDSSKLCSEFVQMFIFISCKYSPTARGEGISFKRFTSHLLHDIHFISIYGVMICPLGKGQATKSEKCQMGGGGPYLIFVLFFTQAKFLENKIYTEIYTVNCQFTQ